MIEQDGPETPAYSLHRLRLQYMTSLSEAGDGRAKATPSVYIGHVLGK